MFDDSSDSEEEILISQNLRNLKSNSRFSQALFIDSVFSQSQTASPSSSQRSNNGRLSLRKRGGHSQGREHGQQQQDPSADDSQRPWHSQRPVGSAQPLRHAHTRSSSPPPRHAHAHTGSSAQHSRAVTRTGPAWTPLSADSSDSAASPYKPVMISLCNRSQARCAAAAGTGTSTSSEGRQAMESLESTESAEEEDMVIAETSEEEQGGSGETGEEEEHARDIRNSAKSSDKNSASNVLNSAKSSEKRSASNIRNSAKSSSEKTSASDFLNSSKSSEKRYESNIRNSAKSSSEKTSAFNVLNSAKSSDKKSASDIRNSAKSSSEKRTLSTSHTGGQVLPSCAGAKRLGAAAAASPKLFTPRPCGSGASAVLPSPINTATPQNRLPTSGRRIETSWAPVRLDTDSDESSDEDDYVSRVPQNMPMHSTPMATTLPFFEDDEDLQLPQATFSSKRGTGKEKQNYVPQRSERALPVHSQTQPQSLASDAAHSRQRRETGATTLQKESLSKRKSCEVFSSDADVESEAEGKGEGHRASAGASADCVDEDVSEVQFKHSWPKSASLGRTRGQSEGADLSEGDTNSSTLVFEGDEEEATQEYCQHSPSILDQDTEPLGQPAEDPEDDLDRIKISNVVSLKSLNSGTKSDVHVDNTNSAAALPSVSNKCSIRTSSSWMDDANDGDGDGEGEQGSPSLIAIPTIPSVSKECSTSSSSSSLSGPCAPPSLRSEDSDMTQPYQMDDDADDDDDNDDGGDDVGEQRPPSLIAIPTIPSVLARQASVDFPPPPLLSKVSSDLVIDSCSSAADSVTWPALSSTALEKVNTERETASGAPSAPVACTGEVKVSEQHCPSQGLTVTVPLSGNSISLRLGNAEDASSTEEGAESQEYPVLLPWKQEGNINGSVVSAVSEADAGVVEADSDDSECLFDDLPPPANSSTVAQQLERHHDTHHQPVPDSDNVSDSQDNVSLQSIVNTRILSTSSQQQEGETEQQQDPNPQAEDRTPHATDHDGGGLTLEVTVSDPGVSSHGGQQQQQMAHLAVVKEEPVSYNVEDNCVVVFDSDEEEMFTSFTQVEVSCDSRGGLDEDLWSDELTEREMLELPDRMDNPDDISDNELDKDNDTADGGHAVTGRDHDHVDGGSSTRDSAASDDTVMDSDDDSDLLAASISAEHEARSPQGQKPHSLISQPTLVDDYQATVSFDDDDEDVCMSEKLPEKKNSAPSPTSYETISSDDDVCLLGETSPVKKEPHSLFSQPTLIDDFEDVSVDGNAFLVDTQIDDENNDLSSSDELDNKTSNQDHDDVYFSKTQVDFDMPEESKPYRSATGQKAKQQSSGDVQQLDTDFDDDDMDQALYAAATQIDSVPHSPEREEKESGDEQSAGTAEDKDAPLVSGKGSDADTDDDVLPDLLNTSTLVDDDDGWMVDSDSENEDKTYKSSKPHTEDEHSVYNAQTLADCADVEVISDEDDLYSMATQRDEDPYQARTQVDHQTISLVSEESDQEDRPKEVGPTKGSRSVSAAGLAGKQQDLGDPESPPPHISDSRRRRHSAECDRGSQPATASPAKERIRRHSAEGEKANGTPIDFHPGDFVRISSRDVSPTVKTFATARSAMVKINQRNVQGRTIEIEAPPQAKRRGRQLGLRQKLCQKLDEQPTNKTTTEQHTAPIPTSAFYSKKQPVPNAGTSSDAEWLTKKPFVTPARTKHPPGKDLKGRKRKKAPATPDISESIKRAKEAARARQQKARVNPLLVMAGRRPEAPVPNDPDLDMDVEMPSTQEVIDKGLPVMTSVKLVPKGRPARSKRPDEDAAASEAGGAAESAWPARELAEQQLRADPLHRHGEVAGARRTSTEEESEYSRKRKSESPRAAEESAAKHRKQVASSEKPGTSQADEAAGQSASRSEADPSPRHGVDGGMKDGSRKDSRQKDAARSHSESSGRKHSSESESGSALGKHRDSSETESESRKKLGVPSKSDTSDRKHRESSDTSDRRNRESSKSETSDRKRRESSKSDISDRKRRESSKSDTSDRKRRESSKSKHDDRRHGDSSNGDRKRDERSNHDRKHKELSNGDRKYSEHSNDGRIHGESSVSGDDGKASRSKSRSRSSSTEEKNKKSSSRATADSKAAGAGDTGSKSESVEKEKRSSRASSADSTESVSAGSSSASTDSAASSSSGPAKVRPPTPPRKTADITDDCSETGSKDAPQSSTAPGTQPKAKAKTVHFNLQKNVVVPPSPVRPPPQPLPTFQEMLAQKKKTEPAQPQYMRHGPFFLGNPMQKRPPPLQEQQQQQQQQQQQAKSSVTVAADRPQAGSQVLLTPDDFLDCVLHWSASWFPTQDQYIEKQGSKVRPEELELPPVVDSKQLFPLLTTYDRIEDYQSIFFKLLMLETWEELFKSWKGNRAKAQACYVILSQAIKIPAPPKLPASHGAPAIYQGANITWKWTGLLCDRELQQRQYPTEGDLVEVHDLVQGPAASGPGPSGPKRSQLGYVERVIIEHCQNLPDKRLQGSPALQQGKGQKIWIYTVLMRITYKRLIPSQDRLTKLTVVGCLRSSQRRYSALYMLPRRCPLLMRDILRPSTHASDLSLQTPAALLGQTHLNEEQGRAVGSMLQMVQLPPAVPKLCLLKGPPGTGKSHVLVSFILGLLMKNSSAKICLCAPSNAAADELLRRLVKRMRPAVNVVRIGLGESVHKEVKEFFLENKVNKAKETALQRKKVEAMPASVKREHDRLLDKVEKLKKDVVRQRAAKNQKQVDILYKNLRKLQKELENIEKSQANMTLTAREVGEIYFRELREARVVCGTLSSFGHPRIVNALCRSSPDSRLSHFTCAVIDEATQATELDSLIPLQYGLTKLILVGDQDQLPPTIMSMKAQSLKFGLSLFERLYNYHEDQAEGGVGGGGGESRAVMMLRTQYRMDPAICLFPNIHVYQGRLRTDRKMAEMCEKRQLCPYLVFDIEEGQEHMSQSGTVSNEIEAECTAVLCEELIAHHRRTSDPQQRRTVSIGIICPYAGQKRLVLAKLHNRRIEGVEVNTVDGFQGREKDIIILSCVRARSSTGGIGFMSDRRRMNVALTRAKIALYIIGHLQSLRTDSDWKALIQDAQQRRLTRPVQSVGEFPALVRQHCFTRSLQAASSSSSSS